jgi:hypothetical protein
MAGPFVKVTDTQAPPEDAETWVNLANVTRLVKRRAGTSIMLVGTAAERGALIYDTVTVKESPIEILKEAGFAIGGHP